MERSWGLGESRVGGRGGGVSGGVCDKGGGRGRG